MKQGRWRWGLVVAYLGFLLYALFVPNPWDLFGGDPIEDILPTIKTRRDLILHAGTFTLLVLLLHWAAHTIPGSRASWGWWLTVVAFGAVTEVIQGSLPPRTADPLDWLADSLGALVAMGILIFGRRWWLARAARRTPRLAFRTVPCSSNMECS